MDRFSTDEKELSVSEHDGYGPDENVEQVINEYIDKKLQLDKWEASGGKTDDCLGECAAIMKKDAGYSAYLYIWDKMFNDSELIARWFREAGAKEICVMSVLYDEFEGDRDGLTEDGSKNWIVNFSVDT